ncbi:DNA primase [Texcoconibacillus texcoconensis]|uniref:DNA primase n=1 Tax=Texcoconibacillus texcoconensis TaxID=1095777 RepID=A0A840QTH2_9BACI|nr:DNA primase [Texcoconibacillus texcoconensis]MBB5174613.1 hypothetical protein [Texcoconibacillus texcoconensis]
MKKKLLLSLLAGTLSLGVLAACGDEVDDVDGGEPIEQQSEDLDLNGDEGDSLDEGFEEDGLEEEDGLAEDEDFEDGEFEDDYEEGAEIEVPIEDELDEDEEMEIEF